MIQRRFRRNFGINIDKLDVLPNLIDVQKESFERFLQQNVEPELRENIGLEFIFQSIFPIINTRTGLKIQYIKYTLGTPNFSIRDCKLKGYSYALPLNLYLRIFNDKNDTKGTLRHIFFEEIPIIDDNAVLIINGVAKVVISQLKKSPGVFFFEEGNKNTKNTQVAKIIPHLGAWLSLSIDGYGLVYFRIDKKKKFSQVLF